MGKRLFLVRRLLPFSLAIGLCLAAPAYASGGNDNSQGNEQGGPGPTIPEPSAWLAMGAGLLVVGAYARGRGQPQR